MPPDVRHREVYGTSFKPVLKSNLSLITCLDFILGTRGTQYMIPSECNPQNPECGGFYRANCPKNSMFKTFLEELEGLQHKLDTPAWCQPAHSEQWLHVDGHSLASLRESCHLQLDSGSTCPLGSRVCDPCSLCLHRSIS